MPKKQKDGRYRAKVTPAPGEKPVYVSARTLRELNEKKQYVLTHYRDGLKPRDITFQALVVEWFEVIKRPRIRSRSTLQNYRNIINAHVLPYFPPQQLLRAARRADLQRCLDACAGMSSIIGSLTRSVLVHAVRYALTENLLDVDISAALMLPQSSTAQAKTAFTPEEEERLLRTAASSQDGLMIYLLYYLGCRRGEMLGLQWGDFDWHTRMVHIQRSVDFNTGKSSVSTLGPTKTSTGDRWVPVPDDLAEILLPLRGLPQTLLISDQGAPLTSNKFRTRWAHLMHAAPAMKPAAPPPWKQANPAKPPISPMTTMPTSPPILSAITTSPAASPPASPPRSPCASWATVTTPPPSTSIPTCKTSKPSAPPSPSPACSAPQVAKKLPVFHNPEIHISCNALYFKAFIKCLMWFALYSYKNANPSCCPGTITGNALDGLQEKVCVQVKRVYDSCLQQEQQDDKIVTITSYAQVENSCSDATETTTPTSAPVPPITFESCRSTTTEGVIRNLSVDRLCDRPCFARVRATIDVPIDILFVDSRCVEYIGKGVVSVDRDVLLSIPDESIVPYTLESMVSAICVSGQYLGDNRFKMTVCVTIILKVLANVEILIPSYGFCPIPPCEEFAENVCDAFQATQHKEILVVFSYKFLYNKV